MSDKILAYVTIDTHTAETERVKQAETIVRLLNSVVDRNGTISLLTAEVVRLSKLVSEQDEWGRALFERLTSERETSTALRSTVKRLNNKLYNADNNLRLALHQLGYAPTMGED